MAMTTCKECKHQISTTAEVCPSCGAQTFNGNAGKRIAGLFYLGLVAAAFYWIWGLLTPS